MEPQYPNITSPSSSSSVGRSDTCLSIENPANPANLHRAEHTNITTQKTHSSKAVTPHHCLWTDVMITEKKPARKDTTASGPIRRATKLRQFSRLQSSWQLLSSSSVGVGDRGPWFGFLNRTLERKLHASQYESMRCPFPDPDVCFGGNMTNLVLRFLAS